MSDDARTGQPASGSRREFLKQAAVVSGALAGGLSLARSAHAAGDDTVRVALIGCGGRGSGAANQALSTKGNVKLVAMADAFKDRLDGAHNNLKNECGDKVTVADDRKFVGFDAYQHVLSDPNVDLVILATPPGFRPIHFEAAVKAGKHVFMEKPVAVDAPGVRKVLAAAAEAKQKKLAVGVGLQRRHEYHYIETVKRLQDGAIGDFVYGRVYWNGDGVWVKPREPNQTEMEYQMRNWYYFTWLSGDHIDEQHIHNLDVINWIKGKPPVRAIGMGGRQVRIGKEYGQIFDHHAVEFEYDDGSRMISQCRHIPGCWGSVSEHVHGTKGYCNVGDSVIKVTGGDEWRYKGANPNPYQTEHDDLFESIRSGNPINEAEYGAHSSMTAILGRMATYGGREVTWNDAINSQIDLMPQEFSFQATPRDLPDANGFYKVAVPGVTKVV